MDFILWICYSVGEILILSENTSLIHISNNKGKIATLDAYNVMKCVCNISKKQKLLPVFCLTRPLKSTYTEDNGIFYFLLRPHLKKNWVQNTSSV